MMVAGIDPGIAGGIAVVDATGKCESIMMPTTEVEGQKIIDGEALMDFLGSHWVDLVIVERVHSMPGQGVCSMFTFGCAYGGILTSLTARCFPWKVVSPQRWKKELPCPTDKDAARLLAIKKFPKAAEQFARKKDHGRAEAALIALWWINSGLRPKHAA